MVFIGAAADDFILRQHKEQNSKMIRTIRQSNELQQNNQKWTQTQTNFRRNPSQAIRDWNLSDIFLLFFLPKTLRSESSSHVWKNRVFQSIAKKAPGAKLCTSNFHPVALNGFYRVGKWRSTYEARKIIIRAQRSNFMQKMDPVEFFYFSSFCARTSTIWKNYLCSFETTFGERVSKNPEKEKSASAKWKT